jgi:hypothetical protein
MYSKLHITFLCSLILRVEPIKTMVEVEESHNNDAEQPELEQPKQKKVRLNETRGGSQVRSWIWKYFEPCFKGGVRYAVSL